VADSLAPDDVEPLLRGRFGRPYRYVERCPSTQRLLGPDAPEGAVVVADEQTEGRGRLGRAWEAPAGTSLLLSLRLLPEMPGDRLPELTLVAAGALAESIRELTGLRPEIKHPNDVLLAGRKTAGVLAETVDGRVTLGIGVNVNQTADELPGTARLPPTSLRVETGREYDRAHLLAELLARLERCYDSWHASAG
jgi:BirA family biotin operon repressor/biotin-[acetyl-CoA-carboxylase] ligase